MPDASRTHRLLPFLALVPLVAWAWSPAGTWEGSFTTPHGEQPLAIDLTAAGETWSGRAVAGTTDLGAGSEVTDLTVRGDSVSFTLALQTQMGPGKMMVRGLFAGDEAAGTYDLGVESMEMPLKGRWKATRK